MFRLDIISALKSGPVRSLGPNLKDRDRDRSSKFGKHKRLDRNRSEPVFVGLTWSFAVLRPVPNRFKPQAVLTGIPCTILTYYSIIIKHIYSNINLRYII